MSKCMSVHTPFYSISLTIFLWLPQDRCKSSMHKSDGDQSLIPIRSLDRWYHWYWPFPWIRFCASALRSSWHVDCEFISPYLLAQLKYCPGLLNGRDRHICLTLCCVRDDECTFFFFFLAPSFADEEAMLSVRTYLRLIPALRRPLLRPCPWFCCRMELYVNFALTQFSRRSKLTPP